MTVPNKNPNNAIVISSAKGNLVKDPVGPFTSTTGRKYMAFTMACNNINKNTKEVWYPRVFLFGECIGIAETLRKGDFVELSHALLNPSSVQAKWIDKEGNERNQADALMVLSQRTSNGTVIPIRILKTKNAEARIIQEQGDNIAEQNLEVIEDSSRLAEANMANIDEQKIMQALQAE
jgi:single-stranded DNA-binding protein